jgi:hypothetical protein
MDPGIVQTELVLQNGADQNGLGDSDPVRLMRVTDL